MAFDPPVSLIFVDAGVDELAILRAAAHPQTQIFRLSPERDGIQQITQILAQYRHQPVSSLHIVSHGAPATVLLGNGVLSLDTLPYYQAQLAQWPQAMTGSAPILLYGCEVAAGDAGEEFVAKLSQITGTAIGASRSLTGNAALGGNWELEVQTGPVAELAFAAAALDSYPAVLVTKRVSAGKPLELVGGKVRPDPSDPVRSVWFSAADLGGTGGLGGTSNGSPGFGIRQAGNTGRSSSIDTMGLLINGQALTPSDQVTLTAGTMLRGRNDTDPTLQDLPEGPNDFLVAFGPTLTTDPVTMSGLKITQTINLESFDRPVMRTYTTFENPTSQDITVPVSWATNFAYDERTQIKATQSGDMVFTLDDRWLIADDDNPDFNGAAIGQLFYGSGTPGLRPVAVSQTVFNTPKNEVENRQGAAATFNLTVPANSTRALLFFTVNTGETSSALATMQAIDNNDNGLFGGLSQQQLAQTVNWDFGTGITVTPLGGNITTEAGSTASFNIALKRQPSSEVTLKLASSNPQEGRVSAATLIFTPANWNQPQLLTVTGVDDAADDGDVGYSILTSFSSSDSLYAVNEPVDIA
ncbi:MAG: DUF4347 domain-containing protein, partial [Elainella sp.]